MPDTVRSVAEHKDELTRTEHFCYLFRMRTIISLGAGLLVTAVLMAPPARAQGVDLTCSLALTKTDPATVNVAYPDEAAIYWIAPYQAVPGTRLKITGRFPHARYFSYNVYDLALRPIDAIADVDIRPDAGAANPYGAGASRTGEARDYTAYVDFGPVPGQRAPNTLYTGTGQTSAPNVNGTLILRVYVPDKGRDETGGVGLPTVTLERTEDGGRPDPSVCANVAKPAVGGLTEAIAGAAFPAVLPALTAPGQPTPRWVKFRNLVQLYNQFGTDNPFLDDATVPLQAVEEAGGRGGFLSNVHNAYVYTTVNRAYGEVSLTRLRAPATPDTRPGPAAMPDGQLRYFSMCTNDIPTQRFIGCATDDQTAVGEDGFAEYVVSTAAARPAWANHDCGYTWLPFGPDTTNGLVLRHMLPTAGFAQAIQRAEIGKEAATMGDYFPQTRYVNAGERPACRAKRMSSGPALGLPPSTPKGNCRSRRRFTIRLDPRLRSAVITVAGKRVAARRGRRLRTTVDLRGLPRGSFRVRIDGRDRHGRRLRAVRTYRTCGGPR
jgi:hypothetical protein